MENEILNHLCCDENFQNSMRCVWHSEVTKIPIVSHREKIDIDMDDQVEYITYDIGEDYFKRARVYTTLCRDMEEQLYPGCTNFTRLSMVLRLFNLKKKTGWMDKVSLNCLKFCKTCFQKVTSC